jgi:stage III sporulation protein AD
LILKICAVALIGAFCVFLLKNFGWRGGPLVTVAALLTLASFFDLFFAEIRKIFDTVAHIEGLERGTKLILKVVGIGYVSGISADVCRELGEGSIASMVTTLSRLEIFVVVSPFFYEILTLGLELME